MNYAVILAGGTGTRFWPFSRELEPKQFMHVLSNNSLLQNTIIRLSGIIEPENIFIISNKLYLYELKSQIKTLKVPDSNIVLEPDARNTAAAIALAASLILAKDKEAVMLVLPSDHYIRGKKEFSSCIKSAIKCARKDFMVTIGIKPQDASTGYGYIKTAKPLSGLGVKCIKVSKFIEKPAFALAKKYAIDKRFFWNSGIFIWKASVFMEELRKFLPDMYQIFKDVKKIEQVGKKWFSIKPISVDYGIMAFSKKIVLVPADFYWTDLGSWDALTKILPKDACGNVSKADFLGLNCRGVSVFSRSARFISAVGVRDLIIADTPDAILVCNNNNAQDVKKIVDLLKVGRRKECISHITEKRPWGEFTVLQKGIGFKIKLIQIYPKKRLSLQRHTKRAEHWVVVSGCAKVTTSGKAKVVKANNSIYVPIGQKHRLENPGNSVLRVVEVQTGSYLEEDDIERFDDDFKR
ncbi:MAG: mannose-1-phosphate guanylyltransferase/mannose-6-phosphate isomerase [Candidatus Omnitrophota bacterium]|jgi:mannose-1-phosphate guanylyltransferase/mannose-6-phosphate isomerase|nr:MAG: mannose-1-phosphate guanylyltransferase/mannose-6-phosphate isomerase [Candidatus Omnitrophota bacterium]